ncbi:MAG: hypothetical protein ACI9S8_001346 [Chlamydiales bacterium]|jgi:hypothetical protein
MFDGIDKEQLKAAMADNDQKQLMEILNGADGFVKFLIYTNYFQEGGKKLDKILEKTDMDDDLTFLVFQKVVSSIYDKGRELVFTKINNPIIKTIISQKIDCDVEFIEQAEKTYLTNIKPLQNNDREKNYLEYRVRTDVMAQNFSHSYLKSLMFNGANLDDFSKNLKSRILEAVQQQFETGFNQYVFLSYVTRLSLAKNEDKKALIEELEEIENINGNFFSADHKELFQGIAQFSE